jgi:nitrate/TMAO reductase-like tetraheme cytochrome c subunit
MRRGLALFCLSLGSCFGQVVPEVRPLIADDHDRLIALMGGVDSHLLEIQRGAGDPIEADYILRHLAGMSEKFQRAAALDVRLEGFPGRARRAAAAVRALEGQPWTAATRDSHYATLRGLCSGCHLDFTPTPPVPEGKPDSWQACGRCHERQFKEWKGTLHEQAWVDPVYRMSAGNPPKLECRGCHSMEPILAREITSDVSYRPVFRPYLKEEGVNCLSCHGLADGSVAASRAVPGAPCRPRRDDRIRSVTFCGACHNPSHLVVEEWQRSKSGKSCVECHATKDGKFTHRMAGVHDAEFVRNAVGWSCEVRDGTLRVSLTNRSGHRLPAEVPSRVLRVVILLDGREEQILFSRPPKGIVGSKDNRLWPDETRVLTRPVGDARTVEVQILYQQSPFMQPKGWITIGTWRRPG